MSVKGNILVVDDDQQLLFLVKELLETFKFKVDTATSGNKAFKKVEENSYDYILSDIRMADGDGIELLERLNERGEEYPNFYFMTGHIDLDEIMLKSLGAKKVFIKPICITDFVSELNEQA